MALVTVQRSPTPSTTSSPCVSESGSGEDDRRSQPRSRRTDMTLGTVSASDSSSAVSFCSCCGAKMVPHFSEDAVVSKNQINQLISESFLTVKGAALFLPRGNSPTPSSAPCISQRRNKHTGDLQKHLQTMFTVLRPEDTIRLAVRLESAYPQVTRYMVVVSTNGRQDTEESIVLGMDFVSSDSCCTVGLVLPLWSDTLIHLDGDGGFSVSTVNRVHVFKPVSVQAMWSALQSLHKACEVARCHNHYPGSLFLTWVSYYQSRVSSNQFCINEWNAMQDVESHRANSPVLFTDLPTERERTERLIKMRLREIMMQKDLENVTCKEIRTELEMQMVCNLREFKEFIDNEMIVILGQMDSPTEIFEHVYLGSEWNASNLDELQNSGVRYILNVTREIDNFFPGMFEYHNIRVYDEEATNLLEYWNETYKFITKAKKAGAKCLVHCKMGVSRSASTVIAYAMKEYGWDLDTAFDYVKERRAVTKPNPSFMKQLEEYQGILLASKQRHNKLWRSHSDSDLSAPSDSMCKASSPSLGRSDSHNNNTTSSSSSSSSPSLHHFLGVAVLQALGAAPKDSAEPRDTHASDSHALSNGVGGPQAEEEVRSDREEPAPPLFPAPRAATLVPEEPLDNAATVPVAMPHLPPSLHMVLPTPELPGGHGAPPSQLDVSARSCKPEELSLHLPERSSSEEVSPLTLGSSDSDIINRSLSDSVSNEPLSPAPSIPLTLPLAASDDNNNPSEFQSGCTLDSRGEADGSSSHSADSIDFFSAREKFLGLAQDGRTRTLSEQQRTPGSADRDSEASEEEEEEEQEEEQEEQADEASPQSEDGPDPSHHCHHDNGVSVRHIVTEIEAICHPASSPPTPSSSLPSSSSSAPLLHPGHPEEGEVVQSSSAPPSHPPSPPSTLPSGSVRRATKQLEEKLKQELELSVSPRSPLHSPSTEHPPTRLSPSTPGTAPQHAAEQDITQEENQDVSVQTESKEKRTGSRTEHHTLDSSGTDHAPDPPGTPDSNISQVSGAGPLTVHSFPGSHSKMPHAAPCGPSVESSSDTSDRSQNSQCQTPQDSTRQLTVDGVTVQESDTDHCKSQVSCGPGCEAQLRLAHGGQELERIQQTLRELQAFLHEGAPLQAPDLGRPLALRDAMDTEQGQCKGASCEPSPPGGRQEGRSFLEQARWHRAVELEARIRQAGLTPPSLMKRSASLAKLDCLELSANDLSGLDLRPYNRTTSSLSSSSLSQDSWSLSPSHPDDFWKKQKVLALGHCVQETDLSCKDSSHSPRRPQEDSGEREEPDGSGGAVPSWRPQGRGYSARRSRKAPAEKKQRAFTVLYNTM